jgi:hypothetical protein
MRGSRKKWTVIGRVLVAAALAWMTRSGHAQDGEDLLLHVREALGGARLAAIQGLLVEGTFRRQLGDREMSGDLEIAIALPDKFLRTERFGPDPVNPVQRAVGVNGDLLLDRVSGGGANVMFRTGPPGGRQLSEEDIRVRRLREARRDFARLLTAFLPGAAAVPALSYREAGRAESPDGTAAVLEVTGPEGLSLNLLVDPESREPLALLYREVMPRLQMFRGPGGGRPNRGEMARRMREAREAGPPPETDATLFLSDYKSIAGVRFPHVLRRAVDGKTVEEWEITRIQVDPRFKTDTFQKKD